MSGAAAEKAGRGSGRGCLVVGYDRGEGARGAVEWAVSELARDDKIVLVHACRPLHAPVSPLSSARERIRLGRAVIDELLLEGHDALHDLHIETEVHDEDPVTALVQAARRHGASAIVIGHKPHSSLHKALGVVTSELQGSSPVPVVSVPTSGA